MAPTAESPDAAFFLSTLFHFNTNKVDWNAVALENGISLARNATAKFNNLAKKYGYKWEAGKLIKLDAPALASGSTATSTAKTATSTKITKPRAPRKKAPAATSKPLTTGPAKKRKVQELEEEDEDVDDGPGDSGEAEMDISSGDEAEEV